ncbi:MAG: glycosyltransferase family 4 protein [Bacteroidota bacterium]
MRTITPITFVIPDVNAFQSGGNIYNKHLIEGLRQNSLFPAVLSLEEFQQLNLTNLKGYYFFDTLYLSQLTELCQYPRKNSQFFLIVHHLESLYPPKGYTSDQYFQQFERPFLKQFDGFLTSSSFTADYLTNHHLPQAKIVVEPAISFVPPPISPKTTTPINALLVANLVERKGILPFLEELAAQTTAAAMPKLNIYLIGTDQIEKTYARQCLDLIEQHPILNQTIHYHGQLPQSQIFEFYQQVNLFISTALMETYGMALQEARAFGLPILAVRGGNVASHVVEGENGFVFEEVGGLVDQVLLLAERAELLGELLVKLSFRSEKKMYDWNEASRSFLQQLKTTAS